MPTTTTEPRSRLVRRALSVGLALVAASGLSACGLVGDQENQLDTVVVGSANFTESQLIGEIYAQTLSAKGVDVEQQPNIGNREAYMTAIQTDNPSINVLPEYVGYLLEYYNKKIPDTSVSAVTKQLGSDLPKQLDTLKVSEATDEDAIVVTQQTARKYHLQSIADLKPVAGRMVAGGSPEFQHRRAGLAGMHDVYGVDFNDYKTLDAAGPLSEKALQSNDIQVSDFFTTQSAIAKNNWVVLDDPRNIILPGNIVPVIRDDVPEKKKVETTLNAVSEKLTTEQLAEMVKAVDEDKQPIDDVAEKFVHQEGLV